MSLLERRIERQFSIHWPLMHTLYELSFMLQPTNFIAILTKQSFPFITYTALARGKNAVNLQGKDNKYLPNQGRVPVNAIMPLLSHFNCCKIVVIHILLAQTLLHTSLSECKVYMSLCPLIVT